MKLRQPREAMPLTIAFALMAIGTVRLPERLSNNRRQTGLAESARVVEGDVEPAIGLYRQRHQRLGIILRADVAGERHGAATAALDLSHQARQFGLAAGADDDLGAFGREQLGGGPADARACAGDDGYLFLKTSLCGFPCHCRCPCFSAASIAARCGVRETRPRPGI